MLCTTREMLEKAYREHYAVPAINTQGGNYDIIWACCRAAQEQRSPMILAHYTSTGAYSGHDWFYQTARWCAEKVDVPVAIHLDHGANYETCMEMLGLGFTSLMFDGSTLPVEKNAALTQRVIEQAHRRSVPVEAEIGELQRLDASGAMSENKNLADPADIEKFLSLCSPDSLAIGIGNAHGYYKGKPDLHLELLDAARKLTSIPLVLHGCTGIDEEVIRQAVQKGVAKINFGTEIRYKYVEHYEEGLKTLEHQGHSWRLSQYANELLTQDIQKIIHLAGSNGKA